MRLTRLHRQHKNPPEPVSALRPTLEPSAWLSCSQAKASTTTSAGSARLRAVGQQVVTQRHRVVVLTILGAVKQGHVAAGSGVEKWLPRLRVGVELGEVPAPKFLPFLRIVAEPLAELGAGSDVF